MDYRRNGRFRIWEVAITTPIDQQLASLPKMDRKDLLALWQKLFDGPANPALRREVIVLILASRLQEKVHGGLAASAVIVEHAICSFSDVISECLLKRKSSLLRYLQYLLRTAGAVRFSVHSLGPAYSLDSRS